MGFNSAFKGLNSRVACRPLEVVDEAPNGVADHFAFVDVYSLQNLCHICLKKLLISVWFCSSLKKLTKKIYVGEKIHYIFSTSRASINKYRRTKYLVSEHNIRIMLVLLHLSWVFLLTRAKAEIYNFNGNTESAKFPLLLPLPPSLHFILSLFSRCWVWLPVAKLQIVR